MGVLDPQQEPIFILMQLVGPVLNDSKHMHVPHFRTLQLTAAVRSPPRTRSELQGTAILGRRIALVNHLDSVFATMSSRLEIYTSPKIMSVLPVPVPRSFARRVMGRANW